MPKVTWLAPVYNKEAWISQTIENIQNQTLKDIEIIFVNDGSTDGTVDVIKHYMKDDKRIRLLHLPKNMGLGHAWNAGTKLVESPIICVASGDDLWVKQRAKWTYDFFQKNKDKDVYYGGFYFCEANMNPTEYKPAIPFSKKKLLTPREDGFSSQYIGHFVMGYTKKIALKVPYRDKKVGIDFPFLVDLANFNARFGWTTRVLGYARLLRSGVSLSRREEVVATTKEAERCLKEKRIYEASKI